MTAHRAVRGDHVFTSDGMVYCVEDTDTKRASFKLRDAKTLAQIPAWHSWSIFVLFKPGDIVVATRHSNGVNGQKAEVLKQTDSGGNIGVKWIDGVLSLPVGAKSTEKACLFDIVSMASGDPVMEPVIGFDPHGEKIIALLGFKGQEQYAIVHGWNSMPSQETLKAVIANAKTDRRFKDLNRFVLTEDLLFIDG